MTKILNFGVKCSQCGMIAEGEVPVLADKPFVYYCGNCNSPVIKFLVKDKEK